MSTDIESEIEAQTRLRERALLYDYPLPVVGGPICGRTRWPDARTFTHRDKEAAHVYSLAMSLQGRVIYQHKGWGVLP